MMKYREIVRSEDEILFRRHFSVARIKEDKLKKAEKRAEKVISESGLLEEFEKRSVKDESCEFIISLGLMTRKGNYLALKIKKVKSVSEFWIISAHESELQFDIPENEWADEYSGYYIDVEPWLEEDLDSEKLAIGKHRAAQFLKRENDYGFTSLENFLEKYGELLLSLDIPAFNGILALRIVKNDDDMHYKITIPDRNENVMYENIEWDDGKAYTISQNLKRAFKNAFSLFKKQ